MKHLTFVVIVLVGTSNCRSQAFSSMPGQCENLNSIIARRLENGDINIGFTYWSFAQTGKGFVTPESPWQVFNVLSADIGYENDNLYGYALYTFNDNSVSGWIGYKFRLGDGGTGQPKPKKKWDVYGVYTHSLSGDKPYTGLGLEYSWDIAGPVSMSYFIEPGVKNSVFSFSTGFMINLQQAVLKRATRPPKGL